MNPLKQRQRNFVLRSGSIKPLGEGLAPLMEGPTPYGHENEGKSKSKWYWVNVGQWVKEQLQKSTRSLAGQKRADPRLLLGVLGCPLAPVPVNAEPLPHLSIKNVPVETSSAQYIVQQFVAATGASKLQSVVRNSYAMGRVKMFTSEIETATKVSKSPFKGAENGWFVLWQMRPDKWYVELATEDSLMQAGSNGKMVWRYTPWLGVHAAKGAVRPLRRVLQGLDPMFIASIFTNGRCVGEKTIGNVDCFVVKVAADPSTLTSRSDGPAEIIRHALFGYFGQKTGLLVYLEDTHLTRIQPNGAAVVYWETTIESSLGDYRPVDGLSVAHAGHSVVTLFKFGEEARSQTKTRLEEMWSIEEVAFNVPGLSADCFIPPADIRKGFSAADVAVAVKKDM